ncbi:MAG: DNA methyltransferase [Dehalococcoidia bacterium]|nr:DNA methyltransferase [Dehalococcoidia bacterium]
MTANTLYYGDNLKLLRDHVPDESVDLIYLDPPFNSNASYNVLFKERSGEESAAQIRAFEDTWHWGQEAERAFADVLASAITPQETKDLLVALRKALKSTDMMAYLVMMTIRLVELRRVLKPTGSIYLHCDPTASHYLKVMLDAIFKPSNFINEIIWKRSDAKGDTGQGAKHFGRVNDTLLLYAKSLDYIFNPLYGPLDPDYVENFYRYADPDGRRYKLDNMLGPGGAAKGNPSYEVMGITRYWRYSRERMQQLVQAGRVIQTKPGTVPMYKRYLDESKGTPVTTNWTDISLIRGWSSEKLGYATQKPLALLERIIQTSSNEGDVVLDPFCGCGTAVAAAHKLNRKWIGMDITHLAVALMKSRLKDMFGLEPKKDYRVVGEPEDLESARQLAQDDRHEFQYWAVSLATGQPRQEDKKGADKGVDGVIYFIDGPRKTAQKAIMQVKSGHVSSAYIRDLKGVLQREDAALGLFITLEKPTRDMETEAVSAGFFHSDLMNRDYPRVQIRTIEELLAGKEFQMPGRGARPAQFKQAPRAQRREGRQGQLLSDAENGNS